MFTDTLAASLKFSVLIDDLQAEYAAKEEDVKQLINQEKRREKAVDENRKEMGRMRKAGNK
jgi:hypothetical protein